LKKIIIIDDEPLARSHIKSCLEKYTEFTVVAECADGFEGIKKIQELKPDLIFLDIQMPRINGFEMLELLEEKPAVIFTTAFDEYALKAFEENAVDYLLKPFGEGRFDKAMLKVSQHAVTLDKLEQSYGKTVDESQRVVVKHQGEIRIIPADQISYIEAWDDYVKIHSGDQVFVKKKTMAFYEKSLGEKQFVRCHRSFLVNVSHISALDHHGGDNTELRLRSGFHLPVSRQGYVRLKEILGL